MVGEDDWTRNIYGVDMWFSQAGEFQGKLAHIYLYKGDDSRVMFDVFDHLRDVELKNAIGEELIVFSNGLWTETVVCF